MCRNRKCIMMIRRWNLNQKCPVETTIIFLRYSDSWVAGGFMMVVVVASPLFLWKKYSGLSCWVPRIFHCKGRRSPELVLDEDICGS
jgi:hypothetical protein